MHVVWPPIQLSSGRSASLASHVKLSRRLCPLCLHSLTPVLRHLLLLLLLVGIAAPFCLSETAPRPRQQHNVWYNGLFISGIAVDESSGEVYFSDAAGNRVVRQAANGTLLAEYRSFFSPMQLAYYNHTIYVADSIHNRVGMIDVTSGALTFSSVSPSLSSCSALSVNNGSGRVLVVDGWGLRTEVLSPSDGSWSVPLDLYGTLRDTRPDYIASITTQGWDADDGGAWFICPTQLTLYYLFQYHPTTELFDLPSLGSTAIQSYQWVDGGGYRFTGYYLLSQPHGDEPMQIAQLDEAGNIVSNWTAHGRGGGAVPFHGWGMYVDSQRNMYITDHGVDRDSSPYGRVVKLAPDGTDVGNWSVSDGVVHSFSSVWYDVETSLGGSCAYWMTDSEQGIVRVAADGTVLLPFDLPPVDPADNRTARFTGIAEDGASLAQYNDSTFVLLDTGDESTTKLWRYLPYNHSYVLINTTAAQLGPNITGIYVDTLAHDIYLTDTHTASVIRLDYQGVVHAQFNTSGLFVQPVGVVIRQSAVDLFVVDSAYETNGALLRLDCYDGTLTDVFNDTSPPMFRPLSLTIDETNSQLYIATAQGYVYQIDVGQAPFTQQAVHRPVPAATTIVSMTANARGDVYMVDFYSRRLIILLHEDWEPYNACLPPPSPSSSSSALPSQLSTLSPTSAWSSSSSASSDPTAGQLWSTAAVLSVALVGLVATTGGATCLYMKWKTRRGRRERWSREVDERLMVNGEYSVDDNVHVDDGGEHNVASEGGADNERASHTQPSSSTSLSAAKGEASPRQVDKRFEYYIARYEVVAAMSEVEQGLSLGIPHLPLRFKPTSRISSSTDSAVSTTSFSSDSAASDVSSPSPSTSAYVPPRSTANTASSSSPAALFSPRHIAELQSVWSMGGITPTFIDSVTDLTILGEGSSGVVYRGLYRGQACVVKLPKSIALTGAAWREWQCHLVLPAHPNLVHFLGALPMSATNYLVLSFVRQGSLLALLSDIGNGWYSRPYAVMRSLRDMAAVLHHMHSCGIVHRDVSCRNILVDSDGRMVLADLGLATQLEAVSDAARQQVQTHHTTADSSQSHTAVPVRWTSPESLASSQYTSQSDVWSLGVALWEMTAGGRLPYGEQLSTKACIRPIVTGELTLQVDERWGGDDSVSEAEQQLGDRVRRLIRLCVTYDVQQRPGSAQLVQQVEASWREWQAEAGSEAARLQDEWEAHHAEVQELLGPPSGSSV